MCLKENLTVWHQHFILTTLTTKDGIDTMFLTRECDYGVRVIRALSNGKKKTVEKICTEELIPKKYAYKIVKKLETGGFLRSLRGRGGGYRLNMPLDAFSLYDIVLAIDADRYINECLREDSACPFRADSKAPCAIHAELNRIQSRLMEEFGAKTLAEILSIEVAAHV